jgi:hypothetical protein
MPSRGADRIKARPARARANRSVAGSPFDFVRANEMVEGGGNVECQLDELDTDAGHAVAVGAIFARAAPPDHAASDEGFVPVRECELERDGLSNEGVLARRDEDAAKADVAGLGSDGLVIESEDDGDSKIDAIGSGDEAHVAWAW